MKIEIFGLTNNENNEISFDQIQEYGGKTAAICYSSSNFMNILNEDPEKSIDRYHRVVDLNNHISVGHHYQMTIIISEMSKIMAMIFNSFIFYNTSERSGRFTNISNNSPIYDKWLEIFKIEISKNYKENGINVTDARILKLAQENARYLLPLTNPKTTMAYTTSIVRYQQMMYYFNIFINEMYHDDDNKYVRNIENIKKHIDFKYTYTGRYKNSITSKITSLSKRKELITSIIKDMMIFNDKCGEYGLKMIVDPYNDIIPIFASNYMENKNHVIQLTTDSYEFTSSSSFVAFADLQRHRTTTMYFSFKSDEEVIIPSILSKSDNHRLINQWMNDISNLNYIPQGALINTVEIGSGRALIEKCTKRLCGRVQNEVNQYVQTLISTMISNYSDNSNIMNKYSSLITGDIIGIKCNILNGCPEPCEYYRNPLKNSYRFV